MYSGIEHPQIVVVLDQSLFGIVNVAAGAPDDAIILVNSGLSPAELRDRYKHVGHRLCTIAATRIAVETITRAIPNTPMIGALTRITGLFDIDDVVALLREDFGRRFPPEVVEGNIAAVTRSYKEVRAE